MDNEKKTILLIQFDIDLQAVHRKYFLREGWEVRTASSVKEALKQALERPVDAVMLDPDLLDGRGLDFIPELRTLTGGAPVLALSSCRHSAENREKAMDKGAADFLPQPCSPVELCERIRALLEVSEAEHLEAMTEG